MALEATFWILAIIGVSAALAVVLLGNLFRAALCLIACFLATAGIYVILSAGFLAAVQVLVYVGAIAVLIILAIMMTREVKRGSPFGKFHVPAFIVALLCFGAIVFAMVGTPWQVSTLPPIEPTTPALANLLFGEGGFILVVEIVGILLLAAVLGSIVLVREK